MSGYVIIYQEQGNTRRDHMIIFANNIKKLIVKFAHCVSGFPGMVYELTDCNTADECVKKHNEKAIHHKIVKILKIEETIYTEEENV